MISSNAHAQHHPSRSPRFFHKLRSTLASRASSEVYWQPSFPRASARHLPIRRQSNALISPHHHARRAPVQPPRAVRTDPAVARGAPGPAAHRRRRVEGASGGGTLWSQQPLRWGPFRSLQRSVPSDLLLAPPRPASPRPARPAARTPSVWLAARARAAARASGSAPPCLRRGGSAARATPGPEHHPRGSTCPCN